MTILHTIQDIDLLSLLGGDFRKIAGTRGGEHAGPCPLCKTGHDRLHIQPIGGKDGRGVWMCRTCTDGRWSDALGYIARRDNLHLDERADYLLACETLNIAVEQGTVQTYEPEPPEACEPPNGTWQGRADSFCMTCYAQLWGDIPHERAPKVITWLQARGITVDTAQTWGLGYNPEDSYELRETWGLQPEKERTKVFLPRGITIPWDIGTDLWRVNVRRPAGEPKYLQIAGGANGLYNAGSITNDKPVLLVEGELDALLIWQEAGDLVTPVATGSTGGARRTRWYARLAAAPIVLVAFDGGVGEEDKGEAAAAFWLDVFQSVGRRLRPIIGKDPTDMWKAGIDLRAWIDAGL